MFWFFSSSKIDLDILLQIVGSASQCLKGTKACVQIVFPNCGVNNEILGLHKLVGKQWNLSKFGGTGRRMALSAQCLPSTNGLSVASAALHATVDKVDTRLDILSLLASDLIKSMTSSGNYIWQPLEFKGNRRGKCIVQQRDKNQVRSRFSLVIHTTM